MVRISKRSVTINGHDTSVSLEEEFFARLKQLAEIQNKTLGALITQIDATSPRNLSSALRVYVLEQEPIRLQQRAGILLGQRAGRDRVI